MLEVKKFPVHMADIPVDKSDMKKCLLTGLFEESAEVNGVSRQFYTYLAPGLHYNQRCIVLAPPSDMGNIEEYNEEKVSQVRITNHWDGSVSLELIEEIWQYIR